MNSAEILKESLKNYKKDLKPKVESLEKEKEDYINLFLNKLHGLMNSSLLNVVDFKTLKEMLQIKQMNWLDFKGNATELKKLQMQILSVQASIDICLQSIKIFQQVINCFDNDRIKYPVDLKLLYTVLTLLKTEGVLIDDKVLNECFGMAVYYNNQLLDKNNKIGNREFTREMSAFYNADGTFTSKFDIEKFKEMLLMFTSNLSFIPSAILARNLADDMVSYYFKMHLSLDIAKMADYLKNVKVDNNTLIKKNKKALIELKEYYNKGKLKKLPEDLNQFEILLNKCNISDEERKEIFKLIDEALLREYYGNGKLKKIPTDLNQFESLLKRLNIDEKEKRYILNLIDEANQQSISDGLTESVDSNPLAKNEDKVNILFLGEESSCFINDFLEFDNGVKDNFSSSIFGKINDLMKPRFKRVLTQEKISYNLYYVSGSSFSVYFIPVDTNTFIVVGCSVLGFDFDKMISRVINSADSIYELECTLLDDEERDNLLSRHESILHDITDTIDQNKSNGSRNRKK